MRNLLFFWLSALAAALGVVGCGKPSGATPAAMPPVQVVAVEARRQPVTEKLSLVGSVAANEMVEIKSETEGIVQDILFREGEPVEKGQLLIRLDESKFAAALAEAEGNFKLSEANFERARELYREKLVSRQEFDQAAATFAVNEASVELKRRQLKDARIHAPFAGVIGARNVSPGQVIDKNTVLTWLVDLDPVKVEFNVPERFLSQLEPGQVLEQTVATYADRKFHGNVYFIAPAIDPATRTALVKAEIPNPRHELKPGMFANLDLTLRIRESSVVIPEVALSQLLEGDRANIFIVDSNSTAQLRPVKVGVRLAGEVEVLVGLDGGEKVIVEGVQKVGPGAKVKLAPPEAAAPYLKAGTS